MKTLLKVLALIAAIPLTVVVMPWALGALGACTVGYGVYMVGHRLVTGRWPKGRYTPEPEPMDEHLRLAVLATKGCTWAEYPCAQLTEFKNTGDPSVFL